MLILLPMGRNMSQGILSYFLQNSFFATECNLTREQNKKMTFEGGVLGPAQDSFAPHSIVVALIHFEGTLQYSDSPAHQHRIKIKLETQNILFFVELMA